MIKNKKFESSDATYFTLFNSFQKKNKSEKSSFNPNPKHKYFSNFK